MLFDNLFHSARNRCRLLGCLNDTLVVHLDFDRLLKNLFSDLVVLFALLKLSVKLSLRFDESPILFHLRKGVLNVQAPLQRLDKTFELSVFLLRCLQQHAQFCILVLFSLQTKL